MSLSVVIPTYNRAHTIKRAIDSVLKQTWGDFELIVVDDGSEDATQEVLSEYDDPRLSVYRTNNRGVSAARNFGIKKARGEWIAFLDSDDEWLPNKLDRQWEFIQTNPDIRIVHGEEIWIRRGRRVNPKKKHEKSGGDIFLRSLELCLISPSAVMLQKSLLYEMGLFDEQFIVCEDYDLWLKITSLYQVGFVEEPIINKFGGHEDQLSTKYVAMDYWRVRSMDRLNRTRNLTKEQREKLIDVLQTKAGILKNGYAKHGQSENLQYIENILGRYSKDYLFYKKGLSIGIF